MHRSSVKTVLYPTRITKKYAAENTSRQYLIAEHKGLSLLPEPEMCAPWLRRTLRVSVEPLAAAYLFEVYKM